MSITATTPPATGSGYGASTSNASTSIDQNTVIDGTVSTSHDLRIEGRVTGAVMCDGVLTVAEGAEIDATVEASGIVVSGTLSGTITCHGRLEIRSTGIVRGRVDTGRLIVVEGAVYEGQLRMDVAEEPDAVLEMDVDEQPEDTESEPVPPTPATGSYSFLRSFTPGSTSSRTGDDVLPASPEDEEPE